MKDLIFILYLKHNENCSIWDIFEVSLDNNYFNKNCATFVDMILLHKDFKVGILMFYFTF